MFVCMQVCTDMDGDMDIGTGGYVNAIKVHYPNVCNVLQVCRALHIIIMVVLHWRSICDWIKMMVGNFGMELAYAEQHGSW